MNNQFPTKLILLRKHFNYSQQDLAVKMNVSLEEYMSWENGSALCNMAQLLRMARLFKVSLDDLFDNTIEVKLPEEEINNSVEIPFFNTVNNSDSNDDNTEEVFVKPVESVSQTSALDRTIVTRIISDNQMEEVDTEETVILKKPVAKLEPVKQVVKSAKPINYSRYIIFAIASLALLSVIAFFLINNQPDRDEFVSIGEINRLVAAQRFSAYLSSKGTIIKNGTAIDTSEFKDVVQISARQNIILGLNSDGTVVCAGSNCDVKDFKDVVSISAGNSHALALTKDNTVLCSGSTVACQVENFKDVSFIYAGNNESFAISNGTVLYSGNSGYKSQIEALSGVKALDTSNKYLIALTNANQVSLISLDGSQLLNTSGFSNIIQVGAGDDFVAGLNSNGKVSIVGNEKIVKEVSQWSNIKYIATYDNYIIGINNNNIIYGAGDNSYNQYEVIEATPTGTTTTKTKLDKVSAVSFTETDKSLVLSWDAVKNADYYQVSINVGGGYTVKTSTNGLSIDASKLTNNTEYMISVVSYSNDVEKFEASDITVVNYKYTGKVEVKQYKVIFYDYDFKTVLSEQLVDEGAGAVAPSDPVRSGYVFAGWSSDFYNITKDTNVYATYTKVTYTINFYDYGGSTLLLTTQVDANAPIVAPEAPTKLNSKFDGWTPVLEATATKNASYTAVYSCTITDGVLNSDGTCGCLSGYTLVDNACVIIPTVSPTTATTP